MEFEITLTLKCPHEDCGFEFNQVEIEDEEDFGTRTYCNRCGKEFNIPEQSEVDLPDQSPPVETPPPPASESAKPSPKPPKRIAWVVQDTERLLWKYPSGEETVAIPPQPELGCPVIDQDNRLFACVQHEVVAFSLEDETLKILWTFPTGRLIPGSPSLGPDGKLRVHSLDGMFYCLTKEGKLVYDAVRLGDPLGSATPLGDLEGNTWISSATGGLLKIDPAGKVGSRPFLRSPAQFNSSGLIQNGTLYIGAEDQFVHAIDLSGSRGKELWDETQNHGRTGWYLNAGLALLSDQTLIAISRDDHAYNFALDGSLRWKIKLPGQALGSPVVDADDRIYLGLNQVDRGSLVCLDSRTQRLHWAYGTEAPVESTPVIDADGTLYFGDNHGDVHAVTSDGKAAWTETVGVPIRSSATLTHNGQLIFGLDNGMLIALRCDSSELSAGWPKFLGTRDQSGFVTG